MFVSFLMPSAFEGRPARHLVVLYKQLQAFGRGGAAFIGEAGYFRDPEELRAEGRPEWQPGWRSTFEYEPPRDLAGVTRHLLPDDLLAPRLRRLQSPWRLYGQLVTRRVPEIEPAIDRALAAAGRDVEAVITFANIPSLERVARARRVPVVHTHFGPLRGPAFVMTGYWDRRGVNSRTEAARRFRAFRRELARDPLPVLSRGELLRVVRRAPMPAPPTARHRIGVALQGEENAYVHALGNLDLLTMARSQYRAEEILVRYHSGAATRHADSFGVTDDSDSATGFIQRCETIATVNSGLALEAMLLGRRCVMMGDSPLRLAAAASLDDPGPDEAAQLLALNFLLFGYIVPYALMFDPGYIRWRLSDPAELEIYRRHQRWYRERLAVSSEPEQLGATLAAAAKLLDAVPVNGRRPPAYLFGAGTATSSLLAAAGRRFDVRGIFDNDRGKWSSTVAGVPVGPPSFDPDATVVVASLTHAEAMAAQLRALGFRDDRIVRLVAAAG